MKYFVLVRVNLNIEYGVFSKRFFAIISSTYTRVHRIAVVA